MTHGPAGVSAPSGEWRLDGIHTGEVVAYDAARAVGEVRGDGGARWAFHCSAIADGSRHIEVGAAVAFGLRPGHLGCWEAVAVTPRPC